MEHTNTFQRRYVYFYTWHAWLIAGIILFLMLVGIAVFCAVRGRKNGMPSLWRRKAGPQNEPEVIGGGYGGRGGHMYLSAGRDSDSDLESGSLRSGAAGGLTSGRGSAGFSSRNFDRNAGKERNSHRLINFAGVNRPKSRASESGVPPPPTYQEATVVKTPPAAHEPNH